MFRRSFLRLLGGSSVGGALLGAGTTAAAAATAAPAVKLALGDLDLASVPVIDTHVHPLSRATLSESFNRWFDSFVDLQVPAYDYPGKAERRVVLRKEFEEQIWAYARQPGYNNYMSRVYGVPATVEAVDGVIAKHIGSDADFARYVATIFNREKIAAVVLQSGEAEPVRPPSAIADDRFVWTWPFVAMLRPQWVQSNGLNSLNDVLALIDRRLETAVTNGCRGFKNGTAYSRPFDLDKVTPEQAERALKTLLAAPPVAADWRGVPMYADAATRAALKTYEDFLFKHVYVKAGQLKTPVIIHTCVAMHPALRTEWNDPRPLYDVFMDDDIKKAATRFVLIHTGYPSHHIIASMISQFPNVYTDMSFIAQFPGALEETYRAFLSLGPHQKVMHASDINTVPEGIGFCAWNSRAVLARILNDYKVHYGWTQADVIRSANDILHANARRVFRIPGGAEAA